MGYNPTPEGSRPRTWAPIRQETAGKEKARFGYPPRSLKARFFQSHWALPGPLDFPPEIKDELNEAWLFG